MMEAIKYECPKCGNVALYKGSAIYQFGCSVCHKVLNRQRMEKYATDKPLSKEVKRGVFYNGNV